MNQERQTKGQENQKKSKSGCGFGCLTIVVISLLLTGVCMLISDPTSTPEEVVIRAGDFEIWRIRQPLPDKPAIIELDASSVTNGMDEQIKLRWNPYINSWEHLSYWSRAKQNHLGVCRDTLLRFLIYASVI